MRRRQTEEQKNIKRAIYLVILSIGLLILFLYFGLPLLARFSTFLGNLRKDSEPVLSNDTTPPAPPTFYDLPEYTQKPSVEISGRSEEGATVIVYANGKKHELLADKNGEFFFDFELRRGDNRLSAKAIDKAGNEGLETKEYSITNDSEPPDLEITNPTDTNVSGSSNKQITIEGTTEEGVTLTINDRIVAVSSDGSFTMATTLSDGENKFTIKAADRAENETETTLTINFSQ